jgi:pimeloyl-ACP methyl ester carboxylesterase
VTHVELAHDRRGSGPPLVLIHGIGSRRGVWDPVIARDAAGHVAGGGGLPCGGLEGERETIAIDLPGFGESDKPITAAYDAPYFARAVVALMDAQGIERPHVAGNSLGGGIALELARLGAVASAAALSPIGFGNDAERAYGNAVLRTSRFAASRFTAQLQRLVQSPRGRAVALGTYYAKPARRDPAAAADDLAALARATSFAATLPYVHRYRFGDGAALDGVPVTIGWGTRDRLLPPWQAQRARAQLPRARHVPLPECGHIPMSDDPAAVAALLLQASS